MESDQSSLHAWMSSAGLSHLTSHFLSCGVSEDSFPTLTMGDFDRLGVVDHPSRQRLFQLVSVVRTEREREREREAALLANSVKQASAAGGVVPSSSPLAAHFGLQAAFFDARSSPTASPPSRPLAAHIMRGEREYLTLPLKRDILLSPPRSFGADSPPRRSNNNAPSSNPSLANTPSRASSTVGGTFQARPMSPNRSLLSSYLAGAHRVTAWAAPTSDSGAEPAVAPSPPRRSAEYLATQAAFHARSFPSSPNARAAAVSASVAPSPSHSYAPQRELVSSPAPSAASAAAAPRPHSPISPESLHALQTAHAALERERERGRRHLRDQLHSHASHQQQPNHHLQQPSINYEDEKAAPLPAASTRPPPSHHRTLFQEEATAVAPLPVTASIEPTARIASFLAERHPSRSPTASPRTYGRQSYVRESAQLTARDSEELLVDDDPELESVAVFEDGADEEGEEEEVEEEEEEEDLEPEDDFHSTPAWLASSDAAAAAVSRPQDRDLLARIRVAVRKRPLNARERARGEADVVSVSSNTTSLTVHEPKTRVDLTRFEAAHAFRFDATFDARDTNRDIYERICRPLVEFVMRGRAGRATVFAYGQTGAGKTYTLMGPGGGKGEQSGLYALAARDIFDTLRHRQREERAATESGSFGAVPSGPTRATKFAHCALYVSFYEIYAGKLFDLIHSRARLVCRADAAGDVHVVGLRERKCRDVAELMTLIGEGNKARAAGVTAANVDSSRSHAVLSIALKQIVPINNGAAGIGSSANARKFRLATRGKLSFIDLAGSERGADTANNDRRTRLEGAEINRSLLALKEVLRSLDQGQTHTPFRGSVLTQVLKCEFSLSGRSRTVMIANIAPNATACEHTLNTLRYADRVKQLKKSANVTTTPAPTSSTAPNQANGSSSHFADRPATANAAAGRNPRAGAGVEAYMPHQATGRNVRITRIEREPAAVLSAASASPQRTQRAGATTQSPARAIQRPSTAGANRASFVAAADPVPSASVDALASSSASHHDLCARILAEEDALVSAHRASIDARMAGIKAEMELLRTFDALSCTVDEYVSQLDELTKNPKHSVSDLRARLRAFDAHLREEEQLSLTFNSHALASALTTTT